MNVLQEIAVREVPLNRGYVALVDAADYDELMQFTWCITPNRGPYARRGGRHNGKHWQELMHRRLMPGVAIVDHINGNGLDNRRSNLRPVTPAQNVRNKSGLQRNNKSGFRGVHMHSQLGAWTAQISIGRRNKHLGLFDTAVEAAKAWDAAAIEHYGSEYVGYLNFPVVTS